MVKVAHILRKYDPREWGGTEMSLDRLLEGLRAHGVESVIYAPRMQDPPPSDPWAERGFRIHRYPWFLPVAGLTESRRRQLIRMGGNIMSFRLLWRLLRDPGLTAIHSHALNRLGGIALTAARRRRIPLVVTIHGGAMDIPQEVKETLMEPMKGGWEWGKLFGLLLRSRKLLAEADAVIALNNKEAELLRTKYPNQRILVEPHAIPVKWFEKDHRETTFNAFPDLQGRTVLVVVARIDPGKNQGWLLDRMPRLIGQHPDLMLVLAGACTNSDYGEQLEKKVRELELGAHVKFTGGLPPQDPRLIGLLQISKALVLPSRAEPFGLVIQEAWAAGTAVLSSRTSGPLHLIEDGSTGLFFNLAQPETFFHAVERLLNRPKEREAMVNAGREKVRTQYDAALLAGRMKMLYEELAEKKRPGRSHS